MGDAIRIRPCPFCGDREARLDANCQQYIKIEPRSPEGNLMVVMDGFGWYWVHCFKCSAQGPKYHGKTWHMGNTGPKDYRRDREKTARAIKKAVDAWNTRTGLSLFDLEADR